MTEEALTSCEICESGATFWAEIDGYKHYRCVSCGHLFVWPIPVQAHLDSIYSDADYYDDAESESERLLRDFRFRANLLRKLADSLQIGNRLLDVGCANGLFLSVAREEGFDVVGQDRSAMLALKAQKTGLDVRTGCVESLQDNNESFDIVTAWEVIEHVSCPKAFFQAIAHLTKAESLIGISTPMGEGLPAKIMGTKYPMLIPPEHLRIFTRKSLNALARKSGFEEIHFSSFSNLDTRGLASGVTKLVFSKRIDEASRLQSFVGLVPAYLLNPIPAFVDFLGYGSEMQIIFKRL